jgi:Flp pilus assembly protein TadD
MNNRYLPVALLALVVGVVFATYSNHFHNEFHFDDAHTIVDNGFIRNLGNIPLFFKDCTTSSSMPSHQGYRPLVTTTLAIDYALSAKYSSNKTGYDTFWYHVSNFSWFVLIVILLYLIQYKLYNTAFKSEYNKYFALLGCAWYGLHTANAETVNYIISRSDILSTLAIVASFAVYVSFEKLRKYYLYLIPAAIGMFAKETTIMFAPALIVYDYLIEQQKSLTEIFSPKELNTFLKSLLKGMPALVVCVALAMFTIKMTKHHEPGGTSVLLYAVTQPYIILHYITQFFFPLGLTADTDLPMVTSISDDRIYFGIAFLIGLVWLVFKTSQYKEWRPFSFGLIWFLLMLLPTSSFIALAEVTNDHRVFLPYIGLVFAMVCLIANLWNYNFANKPLLKYALAVLLLFSFAGYAYGTHQRNIVWKTDEALWKDVSEKSPHNGRGWMNYGLTLMARGDYTDAQYAYDQALIYTPRYYILHINIGVLKDATGLKTDAEAYYKNALVYGPNYVEPYYYYARYLFNSGRVAEAEIYVNKGLQLFAGHVYSRYLLMDIYNYNKDWVKLMEAAKGTLMFYPNDAKAQMYANIAYNPQSANTAPPISKNLSAADLLNQSLALYYAGRYRECIDACFKALEKQPNYAEAYNNICTAYNNLQKYDSAAWACSKALELKPDFQLAKNNLNWAKGQLKK